MTTGLPHRLRTAQEPRQNMLCKVRLSNIAQANPTVRLLRLTVGGNSARGHEDQQKNDCESSYDQSRPFHFLPGQWLDVHVPSVPQAGGFTITSTPSDALPPVRDTSNNETTAEPYIELAVQESPSNPPAAWLWRPQDEILGQELAVRVGGSFIWPPRDVPLEEIGRVVFVAGGVGINPLISMISHIFKNPSTLPHSPAIHVLYSTRFPTAPKADEDVSKHMDQILFFPRLRSILDSQRSNHQHWREGPSLHLHLHLYITNLRGMPQDPTTDFTLHNRRIQMSDLHDVLAGKRNVVRDGYASNDHGRTVCYICGPPDMTDEFVAGAEAAIGAGVGREKSVFCEKWW
ncbi:hypothetical protein GX51_04994 [Blastomyces parvus]|uniref:FAD-binding FR-type domain-containing protein n=1 Tax=Blastomyces parvus TaxID=2060905 RepID=A0A2B7WR13_9EURO|nr:hypothetical protein GX51_04994 [Blastomyces parvus]